MFDRVFRGQFDSLDAPTVAGLRHAVLDAQTLAAHKARTLLPIQPGGTWSGGDDLTGLDNWWQRAGVGFGYARADLGTEVAYPMLRADATGAPLTGAKRYILRFPPDRLPPARYRRISMYDLEGFFVNNPANRYGIGNMAEHLYTDDDGGLTIHIQHEPPEATKDINWLPSPAEGFFLVLRLCQPGKAMTSGDYIIPPLEPAN